MGGRIIVRRSVPLRVTLFRRQECKNGCPISRALFAREVGICETMRITASVCFAVMKSKLTLNANDAQFSQAACAQKSEMTPENFHTPHPVREASSTRSYSPQLQVATYARGSRLGPLQMY